MLQQPIFRRTKYSQSHSSSIFNRIFHSAQQFINNFHLFWPPLIPLSMELHYIIVCSLTHRVKFFFRVCCYIAFVAFVFLLLSSFRWPIIYYYLQPGDAVVSFNCVSSQLLHESSRGPLKRHKYKYIQYNEYKNYTIKMMVCGTVWHGAMAWCV